MKLRHLFIMLVGLGGSVASAQMSIALNALDLVDAKIDYQADYALTSGTQHFHGKVIHAPARERWEFTTGSGQQVLLLRRDIDEAAMLWPERRWYMSTTFTMMSDLLGGLGTDVLIKAVGVLTYQGTPTPGELVLSNVRRVRADPSLFVRPQDYFGIPLTLGK
jgi:hypothetical protein